MTEIDTPADAAQSTASESTASGSTTKPASSATSAQSTADSIATARSAKGSPTDTTSRATLPNLTRRGRIRKWDRPPPPHDWRWYVGNVGKFLIALGLLMFGFVAYQLWGTAIETAAAQSQLEDDFEELLAEVEPVTAPIFDESDSSSSPIATDVVAQPEPDPDDPFVDADGDAAISTTPPSADTTLAVPVAEQNIPALDNGDALARIEIPRIGLSDIVVAGVKTSDLKRGPGHFPDTPLPGQLGNSAIAGHRTTYGQPFHNVDDLEVGDEIRMTTLSGVFVYRVTGQQIVQPEDYQVVATTDPTRATLTLTSCHPKFSARQRIVIFSELDSEASGPVGEPVLNYGRPDEPVADEQPQTLPDDGLTGDDQTASDDGSTAPTEPGSGSASGNLVDAESAIDQLGSDEVNENIADAFADGWFSDPGANMQVGLWGLILAAIAMGAYALSRKLRTDWAGLALGIIPFTATLYFFFQNVNRLLPPNL